MTLNCRGKLLDFKTPRVMGILNVTPDSFYGGSRIPDQSKLLHTAGRMLQEGADVLDLGGYSSRSGAAEVSVDEELRRIVPAVEALNRHFPEAILSVDTFRSSVAAKAIEAGAHLINDISAGTDDPEMLTTVASLGVPYVIMHKKGSPANMQDHPQYEDVVLEVFDYLKERIHACYAAGIHDLMIDPGFGFGKTIDHNYALLRQLSVFSMLDVPLLVGVSRKSMIKSVLNVETEMALNGTTSLHMLCLLHGASVLRVHDVKEASECVKLFLKYSDDLPV